MSQVGAPSPPPNAAESGGIGSEDSRRRELPNSSAVRLSRSLDVSVGPLPEDPSETLEPACVTPAGSARGPRDGSGAESRAFGLPQASNAASAASIGARREDNIIFPD